MSGIAGIVSVDGAAVDRRILRGMTDFLVFRGPDALEVWSDAMVGLGHALLRTNGLENERHPAGLNGQTWITADARIDEREELVAKLQAKGRPSLRSATDAELILHAYEVWREDCLDHLLGDFAFAIWDCRERRLFCARDRFGLKPFYYAQTGRSLVFSNTLDCLRAHPEISDRLNDLAIADFLLFGYNQEPATTSFADIQRLPAAHCLTWSDGRLVVRRYWTAPVEELLRYKRPMEYLEQFRELLHAAVADRLRTQRAGVLMSGGMDSTTMAAVARQVLASRGAPFELRAYTVDYRPLVADEEGDYARLVAEALGISLQLHSAADCAPYERWKLAEMRRPEPLHEPTAALQFDQFRQMAGHSPVALCGEGGDVLLSGQSWPYLVALCRKWQMGRLVGEMTKFILSHGRIPPLLGGFRTRLRRWMGLPVEQPEYPVWLDRTLEESLSLRARWEQLNRVPPPVHAVRPAAYAALTSGYWAYTFENQDPGATHVPVELRAPFFDVRLVNFLMRLPPVPWCCDKELLRVAMRGSLPEAVRRRPKAPLVGDPLPEMIWRHRWRAQQHFVAAPNLDRYVDLDRFPSVTGAEPPDALWLGLRPISLNYWLQYGFPFGYKLGPEVNREASVPDASTETLPQSSAAHLREPR